MTNLEWIRRMPASKLARYFVTLQMRNELGSGCECSKCVLYDMGDDRHHELLRCSNSDDIKKWLYMDHNEEVNV